ncbi:MAG: hypothetical protein ACXU8S_03145 [Phenylobacterium sp.]
MSSDFALHSATAQPPVQAPPPVQPPKPPKSQSDHKPLNEATSSRGPAVVLSGAFAKPTDKKPKSDQNDGSSQGQSQGQPQTASSGQHVNHVI